MLEFNSEIQTLQYQNKILLTFCKENLQLIELFLNKHRANKIQSLIEGKEITDPIEITLAESQLKKARAHNIKYKLGEINE